MRSTVRYRATGLATAILATVLLAMGCASSPNEPATVDDQAPPGSLRVLFIGNSLTYVNDLPGVVKAMADALRMEQPFWYRQAVAPNYSLEDHWADGGSRAALEGKEFDVVVLQQGPSSLPENQAHLREWSLRWLPLIEAAGATPALYMVWPDATRRAFFEDVAQAYTAAAESVDGMLFPVGRAWLEVWKEDPTVQLYGSDSFHPSGAATYLAGLVILGRLYGVNLSAVPRQIRTFSGTTITIPEDLHVILVNAATRANQTYGR